MPNKPKAKKAAKKKTAKKKKAKPMSFNQAVEKRMGGY